MMDAPKLSKAERLRLKEERAQARVARALAKTEAAKALAAERKACIEAIVLPKAHQSWGACRIRAWNVVAADCAAAAKRKRMTVEALSGLRGKLKSVGKLSLDACAQIAFSR
jgi:hypothetical protein